MGTGSAARGRRVACQWKFKREQHDNKAINAMSQRLTLNPDLTDAARDILKRLGTGH
jgi:hypothetical protein